MAIELFCNNKSSTITAGGSTTPVAGTSESWTGTAGAFSDAWGRTPTTGQYQVRCYDPAAPTEIVAVTNDASGTYTVTRGVDGTTPVAHAANFTLVACESAGNLGLLSQDQDIRGTFMQGVHAGNDPFNDGTLDTSTVITGGGSATWAEGGDVLSVLFSGQGGGQAVARVKPITISVGGYIETAIRLLAASNYAFLGLCFTDGTLTSSNIVTAWTGTQGQVMQMWPTIGGTVAGVSGPGASSRGAILPVIYQRLMWVSANTWRTYWSPDGVTWDTFGMADYSKTMTPTQMGFWVSAWGQSGNDIASFEYLKCSG